MTYKRTDKALLPERKVTRLETLHNCPYRCPIDMRGKRTVICRFTQDEGYLKLCEDGRDLSGTDYWHHFPENCPLEDWNDFQKRLQEFREKTEKEKEESK